MMSSLRNRHNVARRRLLQRQHRPNLERELCSGGTVRIDLDTMPCLST